MNLKIVPISERYIEGFHDTLDHVAREKRYLAMLKAPPLKETRAFVRNNIKHRNPQFVAVAGGEVVGWCDIARNPRDTMRHCGMLGIGLLPGYRGKGIGVELMKKTIETAWSRRFTRIELTVREDNLNAIALYKGLGFQLEGVRRNAFRVDGKYANIIAMALLKEEA